MLDFQSRTKKTFDEFMTELQEKSNQQHDFTIPMNQLQKSTTEDGTPQLVIEQNGGVPTQKLGMNKHSFGQLYAQLDYNFKNAQVHQNKAPKEFDELTNALLRDNDSQRMIRTYETPDSYEHNGMARAIVSEKFKRFDNIDLIQAISEPIKNSPAQFNVMNYDVSDTRFGIRFCSPIQTQSDVSAVGDHMSSGLAVGNSEVGKGSTSVAALAVTLACLNGMQVDEKFRSSHITSAQGEEYFNILSQEAKDADNRALKLKLQSIVEHYSTPEFLEEICEKMRAASKDVIEGEFTPIETAEKLGKILALPKKQHSMIATGLFNKMQQDGFRNRPVSRATLVNAVTNVSHSVPIDDVDSWEKMGGLVLNMSDKEFGRLSA